MLTTLDIGTQSTFVLFIERPDTKRTWRDGSCDTGQDFNHHLLLISELIHALESIIRRMKSMFL